MFPQVMTRNSIKSMYFNWVFAVERDKTEYKKLFTKKVIQGLSKKFNTELAVGISR